MIRAKLTLVIVKDDQEPMVIELPLTPAPASADRELILGIVEKLRIWTATRSATEAQTFKQIAELMGGKPDDGNGGKV